MTYNENEREMDSILNEAEGRGDDEFYDHLAKRLEQLSDSWSTKNDGGDLTREEITRLIQRKHFILNRINELKRDDS